MRKITLFAAALFAASSLFSQSTYKWSGGQADQIWDYATANWLLVGGMPAFLPKTISVH